MPERIQRRRTKGWRMPPNTISVTRPSRHGNPYFPGCGIGFGNFDADMKPVHWPLETKADAVAHFREYLRLMKLHEPTRYAVLVGEVVGKNVACFCKLSDSCHGDVWLEHAAALAP